MEITLFKFVKRENSTKTPDVNTPALTIAEVLINDANSSECAVRLTLPTYQNGVAKRYEEYNYCYIPKFSRYYWIIDWTVTGSVVVAACIVDVLASYKQAILAGSAFVSYTGNEQLENLNIIDGRYKTINNYYTKSTVIDVPQFISLAAQSTFVLGIVSTNAPEFGAINYYVMDYANLSILVANMVNSFATLPVSSWKDINLSSELLKEIVSPMQYVVSCRWLPLTRSYLPYTQANLEAIKLGIWDTGAQGYKITSDTCVNNFTTSIAVPYPDSTEPNIGTLINSAPYASYDLEWDGFGVIPLDPIVCSNVGNITLNFRYNLVSGRVKVQAYAHNSEYQQDEETVLLTSQEAILSYDIPLSNVTTSLIQAGKDVIGVAGNLANVVNPAALMSSFSGGSNTSAVNFNAITGALQGVVDAVQNAISPEVTSRGVPNGAFYHTIGQVSLQLRITPTIPKQPLIWGVPRGQFEQLAIHNGYYVQVTNFVFPATYTHRIYPLKREYDEMIQRLAQGVYLE